ncbi:MAG: NADH-ubiquinone oxidoreductase-F iron-sulfur binding region domain-containing protein [Acidimicrobiales bacterium]
MKTHCAGTYPGIIPRLVIGESGSRPLTLDEELALGTYAPVAVDGLIDEIELAGLRGRGGSGFPAHVKWRAVRAGAGPRVVVANGEEGEPSSLKDRWLLTNRPHAVIDGLLIAAAAVGAERCVLYLSHGETVRAVNAALAEWPSVVSSVEVHQVSPRYVAGEESAACRSINGGPALPLAKPPRPFESGVDGRPTLVANVETLAHATWIARHGAQRYREFGTTSSPGTTLVTLSGACCRPGVYEVPFGLTLSEVVRVCAEGPSGEISGVLSGGWFNGVSRASLLDVTWCFDAVRAEGTGVGCGAVTLLGDDEPVVEVVARLARWYANESSHQCGVCDKGTVAIADALALDRDEGASLESRTNLTRWGTSLRGRGACAFLDGAANLAKSYVDWVVKEPTKDLVSACEKEGR